MKLKCLERFTIDGQVYHQDEIREVPDDHARLALENGWAEDPSGAIPTGERSIHPRVLNVKKMQQNTTATKAEG